MASKAARGRASDPNAVVDQVERELEAVERVDESVAAEVPAPEIAPDENITPGRLKDLWGKVRLAEAQWLKARKIAEEAQQSARDREAETRRREKELSEQWQRAEERNAELARAEEEIGRAKMAMQEGFPDQQRELLASLTARHEELLAENQALEVQGRAAAEALLAEARAAVADEEAARRTRESDLRDRELALQREREELRWERELDRTQSEAAIEQLRRRHEVELASAQDQLAQLAEQLTIERDLRARKDRELRDLQTRLDGYGLEPDLMRQQVDELIERERRLRDELAQRPSAEQATELRERARRAADAEASALEWRQKFDQADRALRYQQTAVGELEILRDERDALEAQKETLRQVVAQHRSEWEELQQKESAREPFPACSAYDRSDEHRRPAATRDPESLRELAHEIRHRMAAGASAFFYSERDVRIFLAGLATSRLHLLQGISGTGKTSLPREFFTAMGGSVTIVEVQAGWRDKDDLFGYYNAFEKRFVESEFTKALYRALLPSDRDRPTVVVLDEMNLAHPEQYFSTMLSKLENTAGAVHLDLITSAIPGLPDFFDGPKLPLAPNVWFVGTANHDETTVAFADKTYDRSHVQELPPRHVAFDPRFDDDADPVSFTALQNLFIDAETRHARTAEQALNFLGEDLRALFEPFGVGWGNRLERQVRRFVPALVAADGTVAEAVDHLVATKLVRKLEDRFGIRGDELEQLAKGIEIAWTLDGGAPEQTLRRLHAEARRLGEGLGR